MKQLVHCYKHPNQWTNSPPGLGDFMRGTCHLYELSQIHGFELLVDLHQSGFHRYFTSAEDLVTADEAYKVANAAEYFVDHEALLNDLGRFLSGNDKRLHISTNLGAWDRRTLLPSTKEYLKGIFCFDPLMIAHIRQLIGLDNFDVISIRCGDGFYNNKDLTLPANYLALVVHLINNHIQSTAKFPIVITSDSFELKQFLIKQFGFNALPHRSEHGAFNENIEPVALDLCLLAHSKFNFHINLWASWWSGFSHYTSLIYDIPSVNFRAPHFLAETINPEK